MFFTEVIESCTQLMMYCEVLTAAAMTVLTTLPDHLHYYRIHLFKAIIIIATKEKL